MSGGGRTPRRPAGRGRRAPGNDLKHIVLASLRGHGLRTAGLVVAIAASVVLQVVPPLVLARAVDSLAAGNAVPLALAAGYFALLACSGLASAAREALIVACGEGITHALRTAMMAKLRRLPAAYFGEHEAGKIASLHVNDADAIEDLFSSGIVSMLADLGTVVGMLAVIFSKSLGLGLVMLVALPLLFAFTLLVQRKSLSANLNNRKAMARASGILPETLHVIRSLHVYGAEGFARARYDAAVRDGFRAVEKTNFLDSVYSPVVLTASAVVVGVMMSLSGQGGAFQAFFGMSVGTAVALISYVNGIFAPLDSIGMEIQTVQTATAGWKRVQAFLDEDERAEADADEEERALADADEDVRAEMADARGGAAEAGGSGVARTAAGRSGGEVAAPAIEVRDVSFSYDGETPVLEGLSLSVASGEHVTLVGRTGAGKSTLFKLLLGLCEPQEGAVRVAGREPAALSGAERRATVTCVEQRIVVVPGTVRDQVTLGDGAYGDAAVWESLETVGLADTVRALPRGLDEPYRDALFSQGQKQLLTIARAIVSDPRVLLLDEVTAGLDGATEQMVAGALRRASASRAVLSISHRPAAVDALGGRVVELA